MEQKIEDRFKNISKSKTFRNIVKTFDLDKKEVLDIGCSYGEFLAHFGKGSVGLTVAQNEAEYGKLIGLDIRRENIENPSFRIEKKFDIIFANNIVEHLYSPHRFLIDTKKILKKDGLLIVGVPVVPKASWLLRFRKFQGSLSGSHINFFTYDTVKKTVEYAGWNILSARSFRFKNSILESIMNIISPHIYVVATVNDSFSYGEKRKKELAGYVGMMGVTSSEQTFNK